MNVETDAVVDLFKQSLKLNLRERWYLAEVIAETIGHEVIESTDEEAQEPLAAFNRFIQQSARE